MSLEAIIFKYYSESNSSFGKIFKAAGEMGFVILFIDEKDTLNTLRDAGLHVKQHEEFCRCSYIRLRTFKLMKKCW